MKQVRCFRSSRETPDGTCLCPGCFHAPNHEVLVPLNALMGTLMVALIETLIERLI